MDPEATNSSRSRLLHAGKELFARNGYEQTSTAAIAREAGTSESQLVRYFRGKAGLLEAIFDHGWRSLLEHIQNAVAAAPSAREALVEVLGIVIDAFSRDHDLAFLLLFEGRRMRSDSGEIVLSSGFLQFARLLQTLVQRGMRDGTFSDTMNPDAIAAALQGVAEGMIRETLIAERAKRPAPFTSDEIRAIFSAFLAGIAAMKAVSPAHT
jgi:AcrR family transcriptional regulator